MGNSEVQAAQIDCILEHCRDVKDAQMRKRFSAFVRDKSDEDKAKDQKEWFEQDMPTMLAKMERSIQETTAKKGCAVGDSLFLADLAIFGLLKDGFPMCLEATRKAAEKCPMLLEIVEAVEKHREIAKWLQERPSTNFS
jgi:glutathione S-transferase